MLKNKRGQTTLEYLILVTAVIAALLAFLGPTGVFRSVLGNALVDVSDGITNQANRIAGSRP